MDKKEYQGITYKDKGPFYVAPSLPWVRMTNKEYILYK